MVKRNKGIMVRIENSVITGQILQEKLGDQRQVELCPRATLTPSAHDFLRERSIKISYRELSTGSRSAPNIAQTVKPRGEIDKRDFTGVFCPNIVIFDEHDKINYKEMERYINWLIDAGIHGLYPNGSTGEFVRLSWEERQEVVRLITEVNSGRVPILAGASEANLRDVLRMSEFYAKIGVDAISLVPPFYYKISDESLFQYFAEVAEQSPLDILLYNIPQFTQELPLELMERLLPYERIFGTKDSSRDLPRLINTMHRLRAERPDYVVLVGCEEILFPSILMGASGGTIATSGIIPEVIVDLYDKAFAGDIEGARILQYRILDLINMMLLGVNFPEGFKTGVAVRGFDVGPARTSSTKEEMEHLMKVESQIGCILSDMGYSVRGARACPVTNIPPIVGR